MESNGIETRLGESLLNRYRKGRLTFQETKEAVTQANHEKYESDLTLRVANAARRIVYATAGRKGTEAARWLRKIAAEVTYMETHEGGSGI